MRERNNSIIYIVLVIMLVIVGTAINDYREKSKNDEYIDLLYNEEYQLIVDGTEVEISNMSREDILDIINQNNYIVEIKDGLKQIQVNEFKLSDEDKAKSEKFKTMATKIGVGAGIILSMLGVIVGFTSVALSVDLMMRKKATVISVVSLFFLIVFVSVAFF